MTTYKVAKIPGDGIGPEIVAEGVKVIDAVAELHNFSIDWVDYDNGAEKYLKILGYQIKSNPVVTVLVEDRIGAGSEIGALLGNAVIDVDYCYGSAAGVDKVLLVFKTSDNKKAVETLR